MKHYMITSSDGSSTLKLEEFDECYHSTNGAFAEACHIYIHSGIEFLWRSVIHRRTDVNYQKLEDHHLETAGNINMSQANTDICIIDIGLGTALNCISALLWHQAMAISGMPAPRIHYIGLEKYPISMDEALLLNFPQHITEQQSLLYPNIASFSNVSNVSNFSNVSSFSNVYYCREEVGRWFEMIHKVDWEENVKLAPDFILTKHKCDITECTADDFRSKLYPEAPSAIFYDTFSPATQPHLWDKRIFEEIFQGSQPGSILTTYSSKGIVKQALREAGFKLERLPGPAGKRHILRACKQTTNNKQQTITTSIQYTAVNNLTYDQLAK